MAYDYSDDVGFAREMIAEYGRAVTFVKASSALADPNRPALGNAPPLTVAGVMAVGVELFGNALGNYIDRENALWKECQQVFMVAPSGAHQFHEFTSITDSDGGTWKIHVGSKLRPGDTDVLFFIGCKR